MQITHSLLVSSFFSHATVICNDNATFKFKPVLKIVSVQSISRIHRGILAFEVHLNLAGQDSWLKAAQDLCNIWSNVGIKSVLCD